MSTQPVKALLGNDSQNFSEALQTAQQFIAQNPNDYTGYVNYADVFMSMDNYSKAIDNYEKALAIRPDDASVFFKLGNAYELKEDFQNARHQFQTAKTLEPGNLLYSAYLGRLLNEKGLESGNINLENEGLNLMEQAHHAGVTDANIREQLAIAHLAQTLGSWRKHPEKEGYFVATEPVHVEHAKIHLQWANGLYDRSNMAIAKRIAELEEAVKEAEKKQFAGYPYIRKVPFIVGGVFFLISFKVLGIITLLMGVLYHVSQIKPTYTINRQSFKADYREPFIVRRLNQMDETLSGITIFSSSLSGLFFNKFLFNLVGGSVRFGMVMMMLPYEIIKGFMNNYGLKDQLVAKMKSL